MTYANSAVKAIRRLDREIAGHILRGIDALAQDPRPSGCIQLKGGAGDLRIRVGDYRVVYEIDDSEVVILALRIGRRREVYR
ncbi:MAG: type II toxin-antitoxin system RelE family toxin [Gulosibacter sp.]|uniref:type II toxin-antitoxin system RelE family toxin n=1 Tax=Gulosibacter sp. TaxID=2817531 RepID=UPI003F91BDED